MPDTQKRARAQRATQSLPKGIFCEECGKVGEWEDYRRPVHTQRRTVRSKRYTLHAHHDDYDRPLSVRWLCPGCHSRWHRANGPGANIEDPKEEQTWLASAA